MEFVESNLLTLTLFFPVFAAIIVGLLPSEEKKTDTLDIADLEPGPISAFNGNVAAVES